MKVLHKYSFCWNFAKFTLITNILTKNYQRSGKAMNRLDVLDLSLRCQ